MPYRKVGKNKYRHGGRTYTLKQIRFIEMKKHSPWRIRKRGKK